MIPRSANPMPRQVSRLTELAHTVHEFKDTVQMKSMLELLEAIDAHLLDGLRTIDPEKLLAQQGKLSQVGALRSLLRGEPSNGVG